MMKELSDVDFDFGDDDGFYSLLDRLGYYSRLLRRGAFVVLLGTLANLVSAVAWAVERSDEYGEPILFLVVSALITICLLMTLAFHDSIRRRGDSIFEEVSEELQWRHASSRERPSSEESTRPPLHLRVQLREFAASSQLLVIGGQAGVVAYASVNILITLSLVLAR